MKTMMMLATFLLMTLEIVAEEGLIVSATMYHPVKSQCYGNPLVTADGSRIDLASLKEGKTRWIAISQDLLKIYSFGDTVEIKSSNPELSGKWVIHDTMGARHKQTVDFLVHKDVKIHIPRKVTLMPAGES